MVFKNSARAGRCCEGSHAEHSLLRMCVCVHAGEEKIVSCSTRILDC